MKGVTDQQIEAIQASGYKATLVVTGGGIGTVGALLQHPGASRFLLEAQVPYSPEAMFAYLGEELSGSCSAEAASAMANRAFERALVCMLPSKEKNPILGIACTAALQTTRERKGKDRAFFCIKSRHRELTREMDLSPASRIEQDEEVSRALLELIADFTAEAAV
jgi:nicotinamide mononucleotide (NMN) deamidase PncC